MPRHAMRHLVMALGAFLTLSANRQGGRRTGINCSLGDIFILSFEEQFYSGMSKIANKVCTLSSRRCKQSMQIKIFLAPRIMFIFAHIILTASTHIYYNSFFPMKKN